VEHFVGIDVAKAVLDVAILPTEQKFAVANSYEGMQELVQKLKELRVTLVVLEASGGLGVSEILCK
jgi:transposase